MSKVGHCLFIKMYPSVVEGSTLKGLSSESATDAFLSISLPFLPLLRFLLSWSSPLQLGELLSWFKLFNLCSYSSQNMVHGEQLDCKFKPWIQRACLCYNPAKTTAFLTWEHIEVPQQPQTLGCVSSIYSEGSLHLEFRLVRYIGDFWPLKLWDLKKKSIMLSY